jgi:hypothetical protein
MSVKPGKISASRGSFRESEWSYAMLNADQLLARLYALRKDYADDPEDETYQALHHAFLFISYNMAAFKDYVKNQGSGDRSQESEKPK